MTIGSTTSRWEYDGDGSTVTFPFTNKIFADADLNVYVDGTLQTLDTDYTVSGAGDDNGSVVFTTAPADSTKVLIVRALTDNQLTDLPSGGAFPASSVEDMSDRRTIISQQQQEEIDRCLKIPVTDATGSQSYDAGGVKIENLAQGTADSDAVTKAQMEAEAAAAAGGVVASSLLQKVSSLSALQAVGTASFSGGELRYMSGRSTAGDGGEGVFIWRTGDKSTEVAADEVTSSGGDGGKWIAPSSDLTGASGAWERVDPTAPVNPYWYGVAGDGSADDATGFNAAISALTDGGTVYARVPGTAYKIGSTVSLTEGVVLEGEGIPTRDYAASEALCTVFKPTGDVRRGIEIDTHRGAGIKNIIVDMTGVTSSASASITAITQADPAVVTAASHGLNAGDIVRITGVTGMTEVNDKHFVVANPTSSTFELEGTDSSAFTAYSTGGTVTLRPCGIVLDGAWFFTLENIFVTGLPDDNAIGVAFMASNQGTQWGRVSRLFSRDQVTNKTGTAVLCQGTINNSSGRVNEIHWDVCNTNGCGDGWLMDNCGGGHVFTSCTSEQNTRDGVRITSHSAGVYPIFLGGEYGTSRWGIDGLCQAFNLAGSGNSSGLINSGAHYSQVSDGRVDFGELFIPTMLGMGYEAQTLLAAESIAPTSSVVAVAGNGGAVTLTSNPQVTDGIRGQLLILVGSDNTNTLTLEHGSGLRLNGEGQCTLRQGDILILRYSDSVGIGEINDTWHELGRFVYGQDGYKNITSISSALAAKFVHGGVIEVTTGASGKTVTLPTFSDTPKGWVTLVKKVDAGAGGVTINGNGTNIEGSSTLSVGSTQWDYKEVTRGSSQWIVTGSS